MILSPYESDHYTAVDKLRVGSLCSGYGGLDMGLALGLGSPVDVRWHVEYDGVNKKGELTGPKRLLAHRYPDIPNYGDVKHTDWAAVEPIDILTAGYPCQPFSHAGLRKGADDPRHLWPGVARAISVLRPQHCLLENVRGHVSLGLDAVLGDLSRLGYDTVWGLVRASDAGACHGRARLFILATDATRQPRSLSNGDGQAAPYAGSEALGQRPGLRQGEPAGIGRGRPDDHGSQDAHGHAPLSAVEGGHDGGDQGGSGAARAEWPARGGRGSVADPNRPSGEAQHGRQGSGDARRLQPVVAGDEADDVQWGAYEPAIRRWERVVGRAAPRPTEPARGGSERLSPRFVEWMQGLPAGHVCDVPGLSRTEILKLLGNGVVPQQAALAVRTLLPLAVAA